MNTGRAASRSHLSVPGRRERALEFLIEPGNHAAIGEDAKVLAWHAEMPAGSPIETFDALYAQVVTHLGLADLIDRGNRRNLAKKPPEAEDCPR